MTEEGSAGMGRTVSCSNILTPKKNKNFCFTVAITPPGNSDSANELLNPV